MKKNDDDEIFGMEEVAEAIALIDRKIPREWRPAINVKALDIADVARCPLAMIGRHVYGESDRPYSKMWKLLFDDEPVEVVNRLDHVFCRNAYLEAWKVAMS